MPALTREIPLGDDPSSSDSGNETVTVNSGRATHARANPKGERKRKPFLGDNPFSTEDLPKLEDFVAMDDLPELLMVYDKSNITNRASQGSKREPLLYRRAYPKILHKSTSPPRGCLFLDDANAIASGRRSAVHRAPLVATLGPTTGEGEKRTRVSVAVKTANPDCRSHHLLRQEAKGYATFPREFFTPSKPVPEGAPLRPSPPPAMRPRGTFPGWAAAMRPKSPEPARVDPPIAPRFYGFYVPVTPEGKSLVRCHASCKDFANSDCPVPGWAKSLLLMEECGEPIDSLSMPYKHRCVDLPVLGVICLAEDG